MRELHREGAADKEVVHALGLQPVIRPETTSRAIAQDPRCGGAQNRQSIRVVRVREMGIYEFKFLCFYTHARSSFIGGHNLSYAQIHGIKFLHFHMHICPSFINGHLTLNLSCKAASFQFSRIGANLFRFFPFFIEYRFSLFA